MYQLKILFLSKLAEPGRSILKDWILSRVILHGRFNAEVIEFGKNHLSIADDSDTFFACTPRVSPEDHIRRADALIFICDPTRGVEALLLKNYRTPMMTLYGKSAGIIIFSDRDNDTSMTTEQLKIELAELKAVVINQPVKIPYFCEPHGEQLVSHLNEVNNAIRILLDHMIWWTEGLKPNKTC